MSKYYKEEDLTKALTGFVRETGIDETPYEYAEFILDKIPSIETDEDCISRGWLLSNIEQGEKEAGGIIDTDTDNIKNFICAAPNVIPQEKEGEWIDKGDHAECSICGANSGTQFDGVMPIPLKTKFCPDCGRRMKG